MPPCGQYVLLLSVLTCYHNGQQGELQLISFSFLFFLYFYFIFFSMFAKVLWSIEQEEVELGSWGMSSLGMNCSGLSWQGAGLACWGGGPSMLTHTVLWARVSTGRLTGSSGEGGTGAAVPYLLLGPARSAFKPVLASLGFLI